MHADAPMGDVKVAADNAHLAAVRAEFPDYEQLVVEARAAQEAEHGMSFFQAVKRYPKAIGFSVIISLAMGMIYRSTLPSSRCLYTNKLPDGTWEISAPWQSGLQNGVQVGSIIGLATGGYFSDKIGFRWTMIISLGFMIAFIFLPVFAQNIETLLAGQILMGLPLGAYQSMASAYASEVAPAALRHAVVAYVNLCWVMGQVLASGVLRAMLDRNDQWAYRLPFALQWIWPLPIMIGCFLAPESPWWQVRHGRLDDARRTIKRLNHRATPDQVTASLALMMHTNAIEKAVSEGTQYWDCFRGVDLRRTEVAGVTWLVQNISGSAMIGWSTQFLVSAGLARSMAFTMTIIQYAIGALGTISSWITMSYFGRKTLFMAGLIFQMTVLIIIGGLGFISDTNTGAGWGIGILLLLFAVCYQATVGPVTYVIVAEASSTRLRSKTIVIARIIYNLAGITINVLMPKFLLASEWNWGGRTGLFWGGMAFLCIVWSYFRLPEMKGRTYGELDTLFAEKVSARKFKSTVVDQFHGDDSRNDIGRATLVDGTEGDTNEKKTTGTEQQWVEQKLPNGKA